MVASWLPRRWNSPLYIDGSDGLIPAATQRPSPHCDARPSDCPIELVVLHGISLPPGHFGGPWIERLFTGQLPLGWHEYLDQLARVRVSTHLFIARCGRLIQFVPLAQRAWHAGASRFHGRVDCNDFSIGIELEGDDRTPYTQAQYVCLIPLLRALLAQYPGLDHNRVLGHEHIAPGRKTDPGVAFDWRRLNRELGVAPPRTQ